ncbi:MAG: leucine-rich repeat protein [Christensenellales bacterium]
MKRNLRRILSLALLALLLVSTVPLPLSPAVAEDEFVIVGGVLTRYNGPGGNVRIPKGVTEIGESAFEDRINLKTVTIPNGVTKIGKNAFKNCANLTRISIPKGVTRIGDWAFTSCDRLARISVSESVTTIGKGAFASCLRLTRISVPGTVKTIERCTFCECPLLAQVNIGNGVETIGKEAFYRCASLTDIVLPNSVRVIGESAFWECTGLSSIAIPASVTKIEMDAFYGCPNLRVATVPKGLANLGAAFPDGLPEILDLPDDLLPPAIFLKVGQAMALPKFRGAKVAWRTDNPSVATVGRGNRIKGVAEGTADLMMTVQAAKGKALTLNGRPLKPGETYTIKLKVFGKKDLTARKVIVVEPKKPVLHPLGKGGYNRTAKIALAFTPADLPDSAEWAKNCFYTSSNPKVAQVRSDGTIIAIKPGKATITVYAPNMKKAKVSVTVKGFITDIKLKDEDGRATSFTFQTKQETGTQDLMPL